MSTMEQGKMAEQGRDMLILARGRQKGTNCSPRGQEKFAVESLQKEEGFCQVKGMVQPCSCEWDTISLEGGERNLQQPAILLILPKGEPCGSHCGTGYKVLTPGKESALLSSPSPTKAPGNQQTGCATLICSNFYYIFPPTDFALVCSYFSRSLRCIVRLFI